MADCPILSTDVARQLLDYDPVTGIFVWRARDENIPGNKSWNARLEGKAAGAIKRSTGYVVIAVFNRGYLAHRLAFLLMTGEWPEENVDHVNGIRSDNRWANLRPATYQQNAWNTQGYGALRRKGVSWHARDRKYQALIRVHGRNRSLGYFETADEAEAAYNAEAERLRGEYAHHLR